MSLMDYPFYLDKHKNIAKALAYMQCTHQIHYNSNNSNCYDNKETKMVCALVTLDSKTITTVHLQ